jgi:hypothetical protein
LELSDAQHTRASLDECGFGTFRHLHRVGDRVEVYFRRQIAGDFVETKAEVWEHWIAFIAITLFGVWFLTRARPGGRSESH